MQLDDKAKRFMKKAKDSGMSFDEAIQFLETKGYDVKNKDIQPEGIQIDENESKPQDESLGQKEKQPQSNPALELLPLIGSIGGSFFGPVGAGVGGGGGELIKELLDKKPGIQPKNIALNALMPGMLQKGGGLLYKGIGKVLPPIMKMAKGNPQRVQNVIKASQIKTPVSKSIIDYNKPRIFKNNFVQPSIRDVITSAAFPKVGIPRLMSKQPIIYKSLLESYLLGNKIPTGAITGTLVTPSLEDYLQNRQ